MMIQNVTANAAVTGPHASLNIRSVNRGPGWRAVPFIQATAYIQPKEIHVSEEEKKLMTRYGITSTTKVIYAYKKHRYENITDALCYAERDSRRTQEIAIGKNR